MIELKIEKVIDLHEKGNFEITFSGNNSFFAFPDSTNTI
jgi:hypothetical protein